MAISFREFPWYIHVLIYVALAVVLVLAGEFLPFSPVQQTRANLDRLNQEHQKLTQEVTALRVYERRYSEFKLEMEALQKQLDTLKTIVPEDKELDEFIRLLQGAASASNVQVRRLTAMPLSPRDYHFEMPFERSEEHTSELQSQSNLVCRLLLEKKKHIRLGGSTAGGD